MRLGPNQDRERRRGVLSPFGAVIESIRETKSEPRPAATTWRTASSALEVAMALASDPILLFRGEFLAEGTPDQIRANAEVRRVYLGQG